MMPFDDEETPDCPDQHVRCWLCRILNRGGEARNNYDDAHLIRKIIRSELQPIKELLMDAKQALDTLTTKVNVASDAADAAGVRVTNLINAITARTGVTLTADEQSEFEAVSAHADALSAHLAAIAADPLAPATPPALPEPPASIPQPVV
jgi:hypothetical protein